VCSWNNLGFAIVILVAAVSAGSFLIERFLLIDCLKGRLEMYTRDEAHLLEDTQISFCLMAFSLAS